MNDGKKEKCTKEKILRNSQLEKQHSSEPPGGSANRDRQEKNLQEKPTSHQQNDWENASLTRENLLRNAHLTLAK